MGERLDDAARPRPRGRAGGERKRAGSRELEPCVGHGERPHEGLAHPRRQRRFRLAERLIGRKQGLFDPAGGGGGGREHALGGGVIEQVGGGLDAERVGHAGRIGSAGREGQPGDEGGER